jgi:CubicO group peptidase (beta-lactamase class C family)
MLCYNDFIGEEMKKNKGFYFGLVGILCFLVFGCVSHPKDIVNNNVEVGNFPEEEKINEILIEFYKKYSLPGGISIAISKDEKLVYANSVGYADKAHKISLTPEHRMRIASLSKPITSIAIMKLVEENKINLNDIVFGENSILGTEYGIPVYKRLPVEVTVKNLLEHTAGGWGNSNNDPMFTISNKNGKELIQDVLKKYPLINLPGTEFNYSNFGYYVLGRVIEKISGMTYENYVKTNILIPSGINGMRIGNNTPETDEVEYITTSFDLNPNLLSPFHMDAHGGWVANPIELLKILVRVDSFSGVKDILENETITTMTKPSVKNQYYALGWSVNPANNWWHMGSLPGTTTMMARSSNGFNWVILVNYRPRNSKLENFQMDIDLMFWKINRIIQNWPIGIKL